MTYTSSNFVLFTERVLRLLVSQGWFREPKHGNFANNRLSNLIRKDQPGYHLVTYMSDNKLNDSNLVLTNCDAGTISSRKFRQGSQKCSIILIPRFARAATLFTPHFSFRTRQTSRSLVLAAGSRGTQKRLLGSDYRKALRSSFISPVLLRVEWVLWAPPLILEWLRISHG